MSSKYFHLFSDIIYKINTISVENVAEITRSFFNNNNPKIQREEESLEIVYRKWNREKTIRSVYHTLIESTHGHCL